MQPRSGTNFRLPDDFKAKWLNDLRSGRYEQARQELVSFTYEAKDEHGNFEESHAAYCCLGVAYFGSSFNKTRMPSLDVPDGRNFSEETEAACAVMGIPAEVQEVLVNLNDEKGWNFLEIADWIKENL